VTKYINVSPIGNLLSLNTMVPGFFVFEVKNQVMKRPFSRLSDNGYYGSSIQLEYM
jgi:hypothetical protein